MLVKDQLRVRMEQLKVGVPELAKRIGVSNQSVRHWLSGRSFPGKRHLPELERALSFKLDFSEGDTLTTSQTVEATLQQTDIELFLMIQRMPPDVKVQLARLMQVMIEHANRGSLPAIDLTAAAVKHSAARAAAAR